MGRSDLGRAKATMTVEVPVYGPLHAIDLQKACDRNGATVDFAGSGRAKICCGESGVPTMTADGKWLELIYGNEMSFKITNVA